MTIGHPDGPVPFLTTEQMIEVDRAMIEDFHIDLIQMMENAGGSLAHLARERFLDGDPTGAAVAVLAGAGGNGGGALVAARRLHGYGAQVTVVLGASPPAFSEVPARQLDIVGRIGIEVGSAAEVATWGPFDLILDGLIGYSLHGAPREPVAGLIRWANSAGAPVLSLDVPSGVDATTGTIFEPAIQATATMTLALPKAGLRPAAALVGELYLADISVPPDLYAGPGIGLDVGPVFARADIVRLDRRSWATGESL